LRLDPAWARELAERARVGYLATLFADGGPHVAPVCFALDGDTAWSAVDAKPKSGRRLQRLRNIERDARAALLVDHYEDDWSRLWWVRMRGRARLVSGPEERGRALALLGEKYAPYGEQPPDGELLALDVDGWSGWSAAAPTEEHAAPPPSVTRAFHQLAGDLDSSMFIVTVAADGERSGCLVGFATQTSIHPPRMLVCLSRSNRTYRLARDASLLGVHVVPADRDDLARLFGGETGDEVDKFARCRWEPGPGGLPLLPECGSHLVGAVLERIDLGDHVGFLLQPLEATFDERARELGYHRARRIQAGHDA
jgi:PPOX class probable F420-dependent enzyme